jgi:cytochrome c553
LAADVSNIQATPKGSGSSVQRLLTCHTVKKGGRGLSPGSARAATPPISARPVRARAACPRLHAGPFTTKTGEHLTGILINEDTYSVQIRDLADRLHSFWKHELSEFRKERSKSPMPSYRSKLSPADLDDLVSYLASLRGES